MGNSQLILSASRNAQKLLRFNIFTLCVATVVYLSLIGIAIYNQIFGLAVFSSCFMIAELLVFQIVRTLSDHLALVRDTHDNEK